jgi:hypothetical protein
MTANLERYRQELKALVSLGVEMQQDITSRRVKTRPSSDLSSDQITLGQEENGGTFESTYQQWYTEAHAVVKQLIPERSSEFRALYEADPKRKVVHDLNFAIQDWLMGARSATNTFTQAKHFNDYAAVVMRFSAQLDILRSGERRFESRLMDLEQIVRADLFDSELDKARELLKAGFDRAAGVIAGVVLEEHLQNVCSKRSLRVVKKTPTISDLNDVLKNEGAIDTPVWRFIQRLGDIRNLCGHKKERDPTKTEVQEVIDGADKIIKTVF